MTRTRTELVPNRLDAAKKRFDIWRSTRQRGTRIPEPLWRCATRVAAECGISRAAQVLRLDYYGLKKRLEHGASPIVGDVGYPARFIEFSPSAPNASAECIVELENPHGSKMRVHLKGSHLTEVVGLCRELWNVEG